MKSSHPTFLDPLETRIDQLLLRKIELEGELVFRCHAVKTPLQCETEILLYVSHVWCDRGKKIPANKLVDPSCATTTKIRQRRRDLQGRRDRRVIARVVT